MTHTNKPKLLYTNSIEGNKIEFEFNSPCLEEGNISENFDIYNTKMA